MVPHTLWSWEEVSLLLLLEQASGVAKRISWITTRLLRKSLIIFKANRWRSQILLTLNIFHSPIFEVHKTLEVLKSESTRWREAVRRLIWTQGMNENSWVKILKTANSAFIHSSTQHDSTPSNEFLPIQINDTKNSSSQKYQSPITLPSISDNKTINLNTQNLL